MDWYEIKEFVSIFGVILALVAAVLFLIISVATAHGMYVCQNFQATTGKPTQFVWFDTCYVRHQGEWLRYADYQKTLIARDAFITEGASQ